MTEKPYLSYETGHTEEVVYKVGDTYVVAGWSKEADPTDENPGVVFMTQTEKLDNQGQWDWTEEDLNRNPLSWSYDNKSDWKTKTLSLLEGLK